MSLENDYICRWYVYVIFEAHEPETRYSKIGITNNPLKRLRELQVGNPRPLRVLDYSRRPRGVFGYPCETKLTARKIEAAVHAELRERGYGRPHDPIISDSGYITDPQFTMTEWFEIGPENADKIVFKYWTKLEFEKMKSV